MKTERTVETELINAAKKVLHDSLPKEEILACYLAARGKEITSGKFGSPASSSALVANAFGPFLTNPSELLWPESLAYLGRAQSVLLEAEVRFPWRGGLHPWLDVVVETDKFFIGIESKRYEPYRERASLFSEAYFRNVWGSRMQAFEKLRDELSAGYVHLDAVQLVKHAFGIRTQASRRHKNGVLLYLYAEPALDKDGEEIPTDYFAAHREEVERFANSVAGAEVTFIALRYRNWLRLWRECGSERLKSHAEYLLNRFLL